MSDAAKRLRGARKAVARGRLSFDRDEAREKMRKFRLANPHFYVLQFVRAASVLGAKHIEFQLTRNQMQCTFDAPLDTDAFDDFWASVFEARSTPMERALHNLALGVGSAQALKPKEIRVQSSRREIVFRDDGESIREIEPISGTRIEMTEKFRFGHLLEFFVENAEAKALRTHCCHAEIMVFVDGKCVRNALGEYRTEFEARDESGYVALLRDISSSHSTFYFLRDDVLVRTRRALPQVRPAIGVLNSRTLQTDLSGLELAADVELDHLLYDRLYGAYHGALLRWLELPPPGIDPMELGDTVFRHIERTLKMGFQLPAATRALADWWLRLRIFETVAPTGRPISAADACVDGTIVFSRKQFPGEPVPGENILYADKQSLVLFTTVLIRAGYPTRDVTFALSQRAEARRNRLVWEKRPQREAPSSPVVRTVEIEGGTGLLFAPFSAAGEVIESARQLTTHADGRLLAARSLRVPLAVVIDGELDPDRMYRDLERDDRFRMLATKLAGQVPHYVREVLKHAIEPPVARQQLDAGFELLQGYLSGGLLQNLADAFELRVADFASEQLAVSTEVNRLALLDQLGEIAELPLFEALSGESYSLRELYVRQHPPVVISDRAVMLPETAELLRQRGHVVFQSTATQGHILSHMRPDVRGETFAASVASEASFMARPAFVPREEAALHRLSHRWVQPDGTFVIDVKLLGEGDRCETLFVYRDRILATRRWPSTGQFRAIVRSDDLTPMPDYRNLAEDALYDQIYTQCMDLLRKARAAWCMRVRRQASLSPDQFRLLWNASVQWAKAMPQSCAVPVWTWADGWTRDVVSLDRLRESVERDGVVVRVHRGQHEPPTDVDRDGLILRAPASASIDELLTARVVEVAAPVDEAARARFMALPPVDEGLRHVLYTWAGDVDGFDVKVGLMSDMSPLPYGHQHDVEVLFENRRLELIVDWVPFGSYRSRVRGGSIAPDADFAFVGTGRGDVMRAARLGVAELLGQACAAITATEGELGTLEAVRRNLLVMLGCCRRHRPAAPFDVSDLLHATPLYRTTAGDRLSFDQLDELAVEGVIPFAFARSSRRVLLIERDELELVAESFADQYALMDADSVEEVLDLSEDVELVVDVPPQLPSPPESLEEPPADAFLAGLSKLLIEANGSSRLVPREVLGNMRWADVDGLCEVDLDGLRIRADHLLIEICRADPSDATRLRMLASVLCSCVNRELRVFTDEHELTLQAALLAACG